MTSKFRIIKKPKGYIVEIQDFRWTPFGIKYNWIPFVKTSGMDECWHHSNQLCALHNLLDEVKKEIEKL